MDWKERGGKKGRGTIIQGEERRDPWIFEHGSANAVGKTRNTIRLVPHRGAAVAESNSLPHHAPAAISPSAIPLSAGVAGWKPTWYWKQLKAAAIVSAPLLSYVRWRVRLCALSSAA